MASGYGGWTCWDQYRFPRKLTSKTCHNLASYYNCAYTWLLANIFYIKFDKKKCKKWERANEEPFYGHLIQVPGELVLSQSRDTLEQPLDFYEPDVSVKVKRRAEKMIFLNSAVIRPRRIQQTNTLFRSSKLPLLPYVAAAADGCCGTRRCRSRALLL